MNSMMIFLLNSIASSGLAAFAVFSLIADGFAAWYGPVSIIVVSLFLGVLAIIHLRRYLAAKKVTSKKVAVIHK